MVDKRLIRLVEFKKTARMIVGRARFFRHAQYVLVEIGGDTWTFRRADLETITGRLRAYNLTTASKWVDCGGWEEAEVCHIVNMLGEASRPRTKTAPARKQGGQ